ncbi:MAG: right-handed parallel beta-helix repeat-containing protein [Chloroflexota bacterium]|nr:right-handed parallel beta-helix repeat-containing protein [Chloroflexota bacterium]
MAESLSNHSYCTVGTGGITNSATTLPVSSASGFPTSGTYRIVVDPGTSTEEIMAVTAGQGTTSWTVTRAAEATNNGAQTAFAHNAGAVVAQVLTVAGLLQYMRTQAPLSAGLDLQVDVVRDYGAKFDGSTDDTTAFTDAISAVSTAGGGTITCPAGVSIVQPFSITGDSIRIVGQGAGITTLRRKTGSTGFQVIDINAAAVALEDLTIDGNSDGTNAACVALTGTQVAVRRCEILNAVLYGINMCGNASLTGCDIVDCYIHANGGVGIFGSAAGYTADELSIRGCRIQANGGHGVLLGNGSTAQVAHAVVASNRVVGNGTASAGGGGIWVGIGGAHIAITGNEVISNAGDGIAVAGGTDVTITGNECAYGSGPTGDPAVSGIAVSDGGLRGTIAGNYCHHNTADGIVFNGQLAECSDWSCSGNLCINNSQSPSTAGAYHGITFFHGTGTASAVRVAVAGNVCTDTQGTKTQGYGILVDSYAANVTITGNQLDGNLTGALSNSATATTVFAVGNRGYNPQAWVSNSISLPGGTGSANKVTNDFPYQVFVTLNGAVGVHVISAAGTDLQLTADAGPVLLSPGDAIYFATTVPGNWNWYGM